MHLKFHFKFKKLKLKLKPRVLLPLLVFTLILATSAALIIRSKLLLNQADVVSSGFRTITVQTKSGPVTLTHPYKEYTFTDSNGKSLYGGKTYYVATTGDDNADGSISAPWQTPSKAVSTVQPGDVIYFRAGDYPPIYLYEKSGTAENPIIFSSYPGETVRLIWNSTFAAAHLHDDNTVTLHTASYIWIHGLTIMGSLRQPGSPDYADPNPQYRPSSVTIENGGGIGVRILNNIISNGSHCGIKGAANTGTLFEGNVIFDNGVYLLDHGIYTGRDNVVMRGNAVFNNVGYGMSLFAAEGNLYPNNQSVYNNITWGNAGGYVAGMGNGNVYAHNVSVDNSKASGFFAYTEDGNFQLRNNIFSNNHCTAWYGAQIAALTDGPYTGIFDIDYNLVYPRVQHDLEQDFPWVRNGILPIVGPHNIIGSEPLFVDAANHDYRLLPGSPGLGAAGPITMNGVTGSPSDIGLFSASFYTDPTWNVTGRYDTAAYTAKIYVKPLSLNGTKTSDTKAFFNDILLADLNTTSWTLTFTPTVGNNNYQVVYKDSANTIVATKTLSIEAHKMADINGDGSVDILDLSLFSQYWETTNPAEALTDMNDDKTVDILDLSIIASHWEG